MRQVFLGATLALTLLGGCATCPGAGPAPASDAGWLEPEQAVIAAAGAAPDRVPGTFVMRVRAVGTEGGRAFLNSEEDYRDQRNLTVALTAGAARGLAERFGAETLDALKGRTILVTGAAARTRIDFSVDGRPTGKYYYQTQVQVTDAAQIVVR